MMTIPETSTRTAPLGLRDVLDPGTRALLHATSLVAVFFLAVYGRLVCPFIDGIRAPELAANLLAVFALQVLLRELAYLLLSVPPRDRSIPRHGFRLSVMVWLVCGVAASLLHAFRYDFPAGSHVKLLSGYWIVGAGVLSQLEYVWLERACRARLVSAARGEPRRFLERMARRILEGNFVLTLAPSVAMALLISRYVYEQRVEKDVFLEVIYLGGFCVLAGLVMATLYGGSLRRDTGDMVTGLAAIGAGSKGVRLDMSRLDELGEVATGVNRMVAVLEDSRSRLEDKVREKEALLEVALALAAAREADEVLDLITEKSVEVAEAEAGSLLLLDRETGRLRFHVARGRVAPALAQASLEMGVGIAGTVAATGEPVLVKDAYADSRFSRTFDDATGFVTHSLVTVPLVSREKRVLGVVQVLNKKRKAEFDEEDLELLEAFAAQAATALEKARLYDDSRCMAEDLRQALEQERNLAIEKEKMGAYIPKQVVDAISRSREQKLALGGKTLRASVLFADIQGFTRLSEELDPQKTVGFLNSYMTAMTHVIEEEGGIVDKFIGDGIMAVFTQECCDRPALRAVRSGMRMQEALTTILPDLAAENPRLQDLRIRVGINTGEVVSGNIGSETRMDYTVVGDNVNVASRIESNCDPGRVWISSSTYEEVSDAIEAQAMSPIQVKNRVKPVLCYAVEEIKEGAGTATGSRS